MYSFATAFIQSRQVGSAAPLADVKEESPPKELPSVEPAQETPKIVEKAPEPAVKIIEPSTTGSEAVVKDNKTSIQVTG